MANIVLVYDDRKKPNREISEINGGRSFGTTMYKRRSLMDITKDQCQVPVYLLKNNVSELLKELPVKAAICHMFSSFMIKNQELFDIIVKKSEFAKQVYQVREQDNCAMLIFPDKESYQTYLEQGDDSRDFEVIDAEAFVDLSIPSAFLNFITGGFDARFFNTLEGDYHTVTKRSANVEKIKKEYMFYGLLPEDMRHFFVQPFDYKEEKGQASYSMERYHTTDIAVRYAHGAVDEDELSQILDTLFYFIDKRHKKTVSAAEYERVRDALYADKLDKRLEELRKHPDFERLQKYISNGTKYSGIEEIAADYKAQYRILKDRTKTKKTYELFVSHGDLCFSNILYQKDAHIIKLIDPKGALTEDELYMDEYYDLAKLSHSVCGGYDFFNTGLYDISLGADLSLELTVDRKAERDIEIFESRLKARGISLKEIRLYECSLFLSMLPLHMDNPKKVLGFVLNAIDILKGIKDGK